MTTLAVITEHESFAARFRGHFDTVCVVPGRPAPPASGASPDAFVLDAVGVERIDLVAELSAATERPIVVMSGAMSSGVVSAYLDSGADAVLSSVENLDECSARVRALIRRSAVDTRVAEPVYRSGGVMIYEESRRVLVNGVPTRLTRTEFGLLIALARRMDNVVSHRVLMSEVWGPEYTSARHYLRVYVRRLREKLEASPEHPQLLVAQRGKGYMLRSTPRIEAGATAA
jgi:two-component system KDP operon response regulator KdpE